MQSILYEEQSGLIFVFVTLILGGTGAWLAGRACATTWRPYPPLVIYILLLSFAVRFIHFSMFGGTLLTLYYWFVDFLFLLIIGTAAYRYTLSQKMVAQYYWMYEKSGAFSWKKK